DLERQVTSFTLSEYQREPDRSDRVNQAHLVFSTQPYCAQANIHDQLLDHLTCITIRTTVKEVCLDTVELRIGKVFPSKSIECAVYMCVWRTSLEGCEAVHWTAPHLVCRINNYLAVELSCMGCYYLIHCCTWHGKYDNINAP